MELEVGDLQVVVKSDHGGWRKAEGQEMGEWEPVPVLREYRHADDTWHVEVAALCLETDGAVSATRVDDAQRERASKLGHRILVPVANNLLQGLADSGNLGVHGLILLDHNHSQRDKGTLPDKVGRILHHRLQQVDCLIQASACA